MSEGVGPSEEGGDVAVQMVDGDERQPPRPGERLRSGDADQERADKAGALRDADGLDVAELRVRLVEARRSAGTISSRWWREATSGTTPPYGACSSAWEETTFARIRPSA